MRDLLKGSLARLIAIGAVLVAAGCSPHPADQTVVHFWAMGREGEVVTALIPEFEQAHPGIRIDVQQLPWSAAHEKLLTAFAGDATPDVCQLGNTWIPEFVALHALEPLDDQVAASKAIDRRDYFEGIWDTNVVDGKLHGVPWYVDTRLLFYRRDLLARLGAPADQRRRVQRVERIRPRLFLVLRHRAMEHRRVQAPAAAGKAGELDDRASSRTRGSRRVDCGRLEPRRLPRLTRQGRRAAVDRVSLATGCPAPVPRPHRGPPAATL